MRQLHEGAHQEGLTLRRGHEHPQRLRRSGPPALPAKGGGHEHRRGLRRTCAARPPGTAAMAEMTQLAGEAGHWWVSPTPTPGHGGRVCLPGRQPAPGRRQRQQGAPPTPHTLPSPAVKPTTDVLRVKAVQRGRGGMTWGREGWRWGGGSGNGGGGRTAGEGRVEGAPSRSPSGDRPNNGRPP